MPHFWNKPHVGHATRSICYTLDMRHVGHATPWICHTSDKPLIGHAILWIGYVTRWTGQTLDMSHDEQATRWTIHTLGKPQARPPTTKLNTSRTAGIWASLVRLETKPSNSSVWSPVEANILRGKWNRPSCGGMCVAGLWWSSQDAEFESPGRYDQSV
ncbi:hypothetical protein RRG08_052874 [Elysia crispata]|uniref:Uncharacterized protein n=1 Tax=Elysia crispata TaxID=231223 RepID=A0AAE1DFN9_9GAST|nr:hypothetical protein RRG08_052874 [Elysia crispata]